MVSSLPLPFGLLCRSPPRRRPSNPKIRPFYISVTPYSTFGFSTLSLDSALISRLSQSHCFLPRLYRLTPSALCPPLLTSSDAKRSDLTTTQSATQDRNSPTPSFLRPVLFKESR
ncbi:PREDICTED: uncharacterized protein LOC109187750 isoform X2 [Ipomoea nil]|uniref:uncharacterized protein LOC109187750 isoform X2 n=1 Tax=Ipomoea nil TaxID=35883 RepID=UPI00090094B1|nr:PREDICTED: uncharacterized protein LOC109187750 isoform X2 [Ipomoea nil]